MNKGCGTVSAPLLHAGCKGPDIAETSDAGSAASVTMAAICTVRSESTMCAFAAEVSSRSDGSAGNGRVGERRMSLDENSHRCAQADTGCCDVLGSTSRV